MAKNGYTVGDADERPWGSWHVLDAGDGFAVKRIVVRPGKRLSLQHHAGRDEHWVIASGTARVTRGAETVELGANQATWIGRGTAHRVENTGSADLVMIEIQIGAHLDEADIVRIEDDFGRS